MNGIIKVDKPQGPTSHDVVERVRKISGMRVGHAGTLDPFASGLLIVGIGEGTRILEYFLDFPKTYEAVARLGIVTDTYDRTGKIMERSECVADEQMVRDVFLSFIGEYYQVPPMYSAKKISGRKLYELAREGKIITMPPSKVMIYEIKVEKVDLPYVEFKTVVSGGTYIRALCRDIGIKLGCGAITEELRRTKVGPFDLEGSINPFDKDLINCEEIMSLEEVTKYLFKTVVINESGEKKMRNGMPLKIEDLIAYEDFKKGEVLRVLSKEKLISLSIAQRSSNFFDTVKKHERHDLLLKPKKVFLH
ncbi:tRNA pseudouridine(55) synthase TruB [Athalassotoga saccharophila]|uniref:tRNA pseudouridine(55) synthase TruB n=1 Tax=Athalassotoga saccharophila TaxID=1441386 RepID=UPI00137A91BD|nr:tRNA pseudouridine(55) synthase TruB [Athalassotoga saccharophila]BBJ28549.1 tRNA pseudouridine synthase B [Athalassotoga saccharophila]